MRLLCPHCQQTVAIPDSSAEQPTPCPLCGHVFTPPALLDLPPQPPQPPPPPSTRSPVPSNGPTERERPRRPEPERPAPSGGYAHTATGTLRPEVVRWFAPVGLGLALVLTFFPWVGAYPGGSGVYTQSAWQAARGSFSTDPTGDAALDHREDGLDKQAGFGGWMVLFFLALLPAVVLAVGEFVLPFVRSPLHPTVRHVRDNRLPLLVLLTVLAIVFLLPQVWLGFSLEKAADAAVRAAQPVPAEGGPPLTAMQRQEAEVKRGSQLAYYALRRTSWLDLALLALVVAAAGAGLELWLTRRGDRLEPRAEVMW